jgi:hypothetical protein
LLFVLLGRLAEELARLFERHADADALVRAEGRLVLGLVGGGLRERGGGEEQEEREERRKAERPGASGNVEHGTFPPVEVVAFVPKRKRTRTRPGG